MSSVFPYSKSESLEVNISVKHVTSTTQFMQLWALLNRRCEINVCLIQADKRGGLAGCAVQDQCIHAAI